MLGQRRRSEARVDRLRRQRQDLLAHVRRMSLVRPAARLWTTAPPPSHSKRPATGGNARDLPGRQRLTILEWVASTGRTHHMRERHDIPTYRRLAFATLATGLFLATAGFIRLRPSKPQPAMIVSALLDYDGSACNTNCELGVCELKAHINYAHSGGNDTGRQHPCWDGSSSCFEHACNPHLTLAPSELALATKLLPRISLQKLLAMHETEPNLNVSRQRSAIFVLGCQGSVLASVGFTDAQKRESAALGRN